MIRDAMTLYKALEPSEVLETEDIRGENQARLVSLNDEIFEKVNDFDEEKEAKKSETIQDIYTHIIPGLVMLLRSAMRCRSHQYSQESDIDALQEIVKLQDLIINLCEKARKWNAKPNTERPITGSTSQKILPYTKDMRKAFGNELERRERFQRQRSYDEAFAESHRRRQERLDSQKQLNARKRAEQRIRILDSLAQHPSPWRRKYDANQPIRNASQAMQNEAPMAPMAPMSNDDQFQQSGPSMPSDQWTDAENLELITQLTRRDLRYFPG